MPGIFHDADFTVFTADQPLQYSALSPFVTLLSRRSQFDRWSSFRKRAWFTESHIVLIIYSLLVVLFTQFIVDKMKKGALYQVKQLNHILLK